MDSSINSFSRREASDDSEEDEPVVDLNESQQIVEIESLQAGLKNSNSPQLGNLLKCDSTEIQKTINCVHSLLRQRNRDLKFRLDVSSKIARNDSDVAMLQNSNRNYKEKARITENQYRSAASKVVALEESILKDKKKWAQEKAEMEKQISALTQKEGFFRHEMRKRELDMKKIQDSMRRQTEEINTRGGMDISEVLRNHEGKARSRWDDVDDKSQLDNLTDTFVSREKDLLEEIYHLKNQLKQNTCGQSIMNESSSIGDESIGNAASASPPSWLSSHSSHSSHDCTGRSPLVCLNALSVS
eukprot:GHVL01024312.1.p1 GENE.GHVL01024312.1~~GHVL01024312.1.p1  ORF type:complete len:301 (-),score=66.08 GHVL01024312.1:1010-1912(-)